MKAVTAIARFIYDTGLTLGAVILSAFGLMLIASMFGISIPLWFAVMIVAIVAICRIITQIDEVDSE